MSRLDSPPYIPDIECPAEPTIYGAENITIDQGDEIDLLDGVYARNSDGFLLPVTVYPQEINTCGVGNHTCTYTADNDGTKTKKTRIITVRKVNDPVISGATEIKAKVGEEVNPLDGVTATDSRGNSLPVELGG